ncbi:unnamed protein product [Pieris macdunnoughi]|uniref:Uncharacterized protein n=1 Tax=Pieris macdunnoughi TaxID=345717 RepID=A0A821UFC0_9NEOP|nr:unnamed protein product [Pieris macdunnoughi]
MQLIPVAAATSDRTRAANASLRSGRPLQLGVAAGRVRPGARAIWRFHTMVSISMAAATWPLVRYCPRSVEEASSSYGGGQLVV